MLLQTGDAACDKLRGRCNAVDITTAVGVSRYFPCTVEWFLERCQLALIRRGWRRQLLALLAKQGTLTGGTLEEAQHAFDKRMPRERRRQFMLLQLDPTARDGQPGPVNQVSLGS